MDYPRFNIRVYGLLIDQGKILVTDEFRLGIFMTKFPGGGLKYGEGLIDCLKREFREEMNAEIHNIQHYYTTDFFQATTLLPFESQLINVYYRIEVDQPYPFITTEQKFDFREGRDGAQCFRWVSIPELKEDEFTFPIDKRIVVKLKNESENIK
jgi:8-oxo-dGTP diphosphatase